MIVNSNFVFIHLHKSAGTFFNRFIGKFFPDSQHVGYHYPRRLVPTKYSHLPTLGFVRNPWDFYVSWYSFQMQKEGSNPLFMVVSKDKTLGFQDTLERLLSLSEDRQMLDEVTRRLPNQFMASGFNVPGEVMATIDQSGLGLYSFLYRWMYGGAEGSLSIVKKEEMIPGLALFFRDIHVQLTSEMHEFLIQAPLNTSSHSHFSRYYDDRLAEKVRLADEVVISRHGYQMERVGT